MLTAKPFIWWVGGKGQLVPELLKYVPEKFGAYYEPFVGGGALFFALQPKRATLSDVNQRLVRTYRAVKNSTSSVIQLLKSWPNNKITYLELRALDIDRTCDPEVAAWFIYLNKTGFNGLYRVNRLDKFNVSYGANPNATVCDEENLRACAQVLANATIFAAQFWEVPNLVVPGDFVYFDPPYDPVSKTANFTAYTKGGFGRDAQVCLRDVALKLARAGTYVLLSNANTEFIRELYATDFDLHEVGAARTINCDSAKRGKVTELIIVPKGQVST